MAGEAARSTSDLPWRILGNWVFTPGSITWMLGAGSHLQYYLGHGLKVTIVLLESYPENYFTSPRSSSSGLAILSIVELRFGNTHTLCSGGPKYMQIREYKKADIVNENGTWLYRSCERRGECARVQDIGCARVKASRRPPLATPLTPQASSPQSTCR